MKNAPEVIFWPVELIISCTVELVFSFVFLTTSLPAYFINIVEV